MRPIDADDLLEIIEKYCGGYDCHDSESFDKTAVRMAIRSAPTLSLWDVAGQRTLTAGRYMPVEIAVECLRNANLGGVLKDAAECLIHIAEQSAVDQGQVPSAEDGLRTDLISREAAMRLALRYYRDAQQSVRYCHEREDDFGTIGFSGQREAFRWMAMALLALPAADAEPTRRSKMSGGNAEGGGGAAAE